jgi:hypothetical protein
MWCDRASYSEFGGKVVSGIITGIIGLIIAAIKETICTGSGLVGVEVIGDLITGFATGGIGGTIISWVDIIVEIIGDVITGFMSGGIGVIIQNVISAIVTGIEGAFGIIGNLLG